VVPKSRASNGQKHGRPLIYASTLEHELTHRQKMCVGFESLQSISLNRTGILHRVQSPREFQFSLCNYSPHLSLILHSHLPLSSSQRTPHPPPPPLAVDCRPLITAFLASHFFCTSLLTKEKERQRRITGSDGAIWHFKQIF